MRTVADSGCEQAGLVLVVWGRGVGVGIRHLEQRRGLNELIRVG